jgi:hypothetical protein
MAAARAVASLLARPYRYWKSATYFDPSIAESFRTPSEQLAWFESAREYNASLRRTHMQRYAREQLLPRLTFDGGWPSFSVRGSMSGANKDSKTPNDDEPEGL